MKTRIILLVVFSFCLLGDTFAKRKVEEPPSDRQQWADLCYKIAQPILENMSKGELQKNMQLELSPTWDGRDKRVAYMEAFGRLMAGISPWLSLPADNTAEGQQRRQLQEWALQAYKNAVRSPKPGLLVVGRTNPNSGRRSLHRRKFFFVHQMPPGSCWMKSPGNVTSNVSKDCVSSVLLTITGCCSVP